MRCFSCDIDYEGDLESCEICGRPLEIDSDRYFKAAMEALSTGDLDEAVSLFRGCLEVNPEHLTGRFNLGIALSLGDQCDPALEQLLMVAEQDANYPGLFTALGQAAFGSYLFHKEQANARQWQMIRLLQEALERDETDVDACFSLGNAHMALDQPEEALPYLKRAAALDPGSPAVYFAMAKVFKSLGRYREARVMAKKSLVMAPDDDGFREEMEELFTDLQQYPTVAEGQ